MDCWGAKERGVGGRAEEREAEKLDEGKGGEQGHSGNAGHLGAEAPVSRP